MKHDDLFTSLARPHAPADQGDGVTALGLRLARAEDEAEVVALWRTCGLVPGPDDPVTEFRFALSGPASDILLQEEDGMVVASAMVGHDGHRGWFWCVATAPSHRRRGFGRRMVEACEAWMRDRGVPKSHLLIRDTNRGVVGFYERLGYAVVPLIPMQKLLR